MSARTRWLLLAFWIAPALVATLGMALVPSRLRPDLGLVSVFGIQLALWFGWGLWSLLLAEVGRRFPFERGRILRALVVHVPLSAIVVVAQILIVSSIARAFGLAQPLSLASTLSVGLRGYGDLFTVIFWGIVVAHGALRWNAAYREQQRRTAQLDSDLAAAQLRALQAQLRPHFLFNALNSVVTMIDRDPAAAQRMVIQLADLLRATLRGGERQEISLHQEIELTRLYLAIEEVRFSDRLRVEWQIADGLTGDVPALALQPLVENAIVHGIARRSEPGHVTIRIRRDDGALEIRVRDDGPGPQSSGEGRTPERDGGVGLSNLRARLTRLYGAAASLELAPVASGGTEVTLRLPSAAHP